MAFGVGAGAVLARSRLSFGEPADSPSIDPWDLPLADAAPEAEAFPELDCVRGLLDADVIEAAARRAAALGTGADRVLIASGAIGEEAYLRALGEKFSGSPSSRSTALPARSVRSATSG